jgi:hypothetical protein
MKRPFTFPAPGPEVPLRLEAGTTEPGISYSLARLDNSSLMPAPMVELSDTFLI